MSETLQLGDFVWVRNAEAQAHVSRIKEFGDDGDTVALESLIGATEGFTVPQAALEAVHRKVTKEELRLIRKLKGRTIFLKDKGNLSPRKIYDVYLLHEAVVFTFHDPVSDRLMGPYPVEKLDRQYHLSLVCVVHELPADFFKRDLIYYPYGVTS